MMYRTYLAPTEHPPTALAVKRALLTYDSVVLSDPGDRDLFPPQLFLPAIGMPPVISLNTGPVRPLGKVDGYDEAFDALMEEIHYARREGVVDVVSTYDSSAGQRLTIGRVATGGYPLDAQSMLWVYRNFARDQNALKSALEGDEMITGASEEVLNALAGDRASADLSINGDPALPDIEANLSRESIRTAISKIARARVSAVMKSVGYCATKELVPTFSDPRYGQVLGVLTGNAYMALDVVAEDDPAFALRSRVLEIAHDEYVDYEVLQEMHLDDVLRLRTRAWGRQAEARDELLRSAAILARESSSAADFDAEVAGRIREYARLYGEVCEERKALGFRVNCTLAMAASGTAATALTTIGAVSQHQNAIGVAALLMLGAIGWTVSQVRDFKPLMDDLKRLDEDRNENACVGLHNYYLQLG